MIWVLLMTAIFGPLVVPSVMGVLVWMERGKHNARISQQFPSHTDWWRQRSSAGLSPGHAVALVPRHFKLSDALNRSGILSLAVVALMAPALWQSLFVANFLFAVHPVVCVAWWLELRRRGVIHAEVYPLAAWIMAYVAWAAGLLAPAEWVAWAGPASSGGSDGATSGLWLLYAASGLACSVGGIALARMHRPPITPLLCVAAWIPLASIVWSASFLFGFLGLVMTVGVVGFGISKEARRLRDEAATRDEAYAPISLPGLSLAGSLRLIASVGAVVIAASVLSIGIRESGLLNQAGVIVATWSALLIASLLAVWFARRDRAARNVAAWAAGAFIAVMSLVAFQMMLAETWPWFFDPSWVLEASVEGEPSTFLLFTYVQALAVGVIAAVLLVVAVIRGRTREYGAMLLGILWVPIALATAGMHSDDGRGAALIDPVGIAGATAMGCVLLVIMWRVLGPGEIKAETGRSSSVMPVHDYTLTEMQRIPDVDVDHAAGMSIAGSETVEG